MKLELYSKNLMNGISKTVAIMKKLMKLFVLVAAAAMALASCQKNEITGPETQEVHFTIKADIAETKTYITENVDKTYTPSWSKGDKIGVLFALEENAKAEDFENTAVAGEEATFEGKHAFTVVEGASEVDGYLYAFYPSSAFDKVYSDGGVRLDLKVTQYPTSTSFDPSCDLLIAKPCHYVAEATGADAEVLIDDMYFARMMSVLRINLNSEFLSNETVNSVSFDADGVDFTGAMKFNLATGEFVGNQSTSQDLSEVKAVYSAEDPIAVAGEKNSAYLVVAPVTIPSGTALTFTIETENYIIVKTINAPADMEMPAGNIAVINLTISEENCKPQGEEPELPGENTAYYEKVTSEPDDWSGKYLLVNENAAVTLSAISTTSTKYGIGKEVSISNGKIVATDELTACQVEIAKATSTTDAYVMMFGGKYLTWTSGNSLNVATSESQNTNWTISLSEGNAVISNCNDGTRKIFWNPTSPRFACYNKTGQSAVQLYMLIDPNEGGSVTPEPDQPKTPVLTVTESPTDDIAAEGGNVTIKYSVVNPVEDQSVKASVDADWVSEFDYSVENEVSFVVDSNTSDQPREATITLKYEGAADVNVTVKQAGYVDPSIVQKVTVAEFNALTGNEIATYQLSGYVTEIYQAYSSQYNNISFYIEDETGKVLIFRMECTDELGSSIKVGDQITVKGKPTIYNEKIQMAQGGTCIDYKSAPTLEVSPDNITVEADVTTAVFELSCDTGYDITYPEGVVKVSEVHSNETGSSTYTVGFPANETTEPIKYVITVKADAEGFDVEKTVTITQKADSQGSGDEPAELITVSNTIKDIAVANGWKNGAKYGEVNIDTIIKATAVGGSNTGKYYSSDQSWRLYQNENGKLTLSSTNGYLINSVKLTFTTKDNGVLKYSNTTMTSNATYDINASSVSFTVGSTSGNKGKVFITAIEVVYQKN